jgi:hypothetical protein
MYLAIFFLLVSFSVSEPPLRDYEVIEIPIQVKVGYGPHIAGFSVLFWSNNPHDKMNEEHAPLLRGIPEDWTKTDVHEIVFDSYQHHFQEFKLGKIDEKEFQEIKQYYEKESPRQLSDKPIKSSAHIILSYDKDGQLIYLLDTDNDLDFSDEEIQHPPLANWEKLDSLSKLAMNVSAQVIINNQITSVEVPVLILVSDKGLLLYNYPRYAVAEFEGSIISICGSPSEITMNKPSIMLAGKDGEKRSPAVDYMKYLKINNLVFQNLGVDYNQQKLRLKKMPDDTLLYSAQVGFFAEPFFR